MALKDYDEILNLIENDLSLDWKQIKGRIANMMCTTDEKTNEFFKVIHPDGETMRGHYNFRRACNALADCANGYTQEMVAEKYNYSDATHVSKDIALRLGKPATELLEAGFKLPRLKFISDLIDDEGIMSKKDKDIIEEKECVINKMHTNEEMLKKELILAIDKILSLENSNEKLKADIRRTSIKEQTDGRGIDMGNLSIDMYEEFLNIERCRLLYNMTPESILDLYNKSLKTGENLEDLCIEADEQFLFKEESYDIENSNYRIEYEGTLAENYFEYYGDDDPADCEEDPYGKEPWPDELYEKTDDVCPEVVVEQEWEELPEENWDQIDRIVQEIEESALKKNCEEIINESIDEHIKDEDIPF